jgi:hypothetical protein
MMNIAKPLFYENLPKSNKNNDKISLEVINQAKTLDLTFIFSFNIAILNRYGSATKASIFSSV